MTNILIACIFDTVIYSLNLTAFYSDLVWS
jgi:hypothetical protein